MTYAGSGQAARVSAGGTSYVYDLRGMASETTWGTTTRYVRDPSGTLLGERIGSTTYYYVFDGLGSVIGLTGASGSLVATYAYDPYGNLVASTGTTPNRYRFAGGYQDAATGLYKLGERYYDPVLGRWSQPDPAGATRTDPGASSSYVYSGDDPVNALDLNGLMPIAGGSGGWTPKWKPRWKPSWSPRWTPRWSPGWRPTWAPNLVHDPAQPVQPVTPVPNGGGTASDAGPGTRCLGGAAFGGMAAGGAAELLAATPEAYAASLAAGLSATGVGLAVVGFGLLVMWLACT